ncbi:hypothetical protein [Oceanibaculum nanhaiense]|uniref:hypothetical protein n=1 Tax=Oceanibaculum nanhaiense TaxID=1909734 RepID=UPI003F6ECB0F
MFEIIEQDVAEAVERLSHEYRLTRIGKEQLYMFFLVINEEIESKGNKSVSTRGIEKFLNLAGSNRSLGLLGREAVSGGDLLHAWNFYYNRRMSVRSEDREVLQINAMFIDKR